MYNNASSEETNENIEKSFNIIKNSLINTDKEDEIINTIVENPNIFVNIENINDIYSYLNLEEEFQKCINDKKECVIPSISKIVDETFIDLTIKAMNEYIYLSDEQRTKNLEINYIHLFN